MPESIRMTVSLRQPLEVTAKRIKGAVEFFLYYRIVARFFVRAQRDLDEGEETGRIIDSIENAILYMDRRKGLK